MNNIDKILNDFQDKFGIKPKPNKDLKVIPTGFKELDSAMNIGGIPRGKTTEISGAAGTGKSILGYCLIREAQKQGAYVLYIDADRKFDRDYATRTGVKLEELLVCNPPTGEQAIQVIYYYLSYRLIDLIIIDSIPALLPLEELMGETNNSSQVKLIATMLRELMAEIENTKSSLVCINQVRSSFAAGGSITPFNNIFGYYASLRIHLRKVKSIKKWRKLKGYLIEANIHKNRWGERRSTNFELPILSK
jgi:recombination protein RecA